MAENVKYVEIDEVRNLLPMDLRISTDHYWAISTGLNHIDIWGRTNWYDNYNQNFGVRLVVTIKNNYKISSGKGTSAEPYILNNR